MFLPKGSRGKLPLQAVCVAGFRTYIACVYSDLLLHYNHNIIVIAKTNMHRKIKISGVR